MHPLLAALGPEMVSAPPAEKLEQYSSLVKPKDAHVLVAALLGGAEYLITLDKCHFMTPVIKAADLVIKIMTPGDFLTRILNPPPANRGAILP